MYYVAFEYITRVVFRLVFILWWRIICMALNRKPLKAVVQKRVAARKAFLWGKLTAGISEATVLESVKRARFEEFLKQNGFRKPLRGLQQEANAVFTNLNQAAFHDEALFVISAKGEASFFRDARVFLRLLDEAKGKGLI